MLPPGERPELRYDDFSETAALIEQGHANTARFLAARAEDIEVQRSSSSLRSRLARLRLPSNVDRTDAAERAATDPGGAIVMGDESTDPQGPRATDPQGPRATDPQGPRATDPQGPRATDPQGPED